MKIAIVSDIHGNYDAWVAVKKEFDKLQVDKVWVLGDICGYYYDTHKILEELVQFDYEFIRGNHEDILQRLVMKTTDKDEIRLKYGSGHDFCQQNLSDEQISLLSNAPVSKKIEIGDTRFFLCHGSPLDHNEYLYPDTSETRLNECHNKDYNYIFIGHSHYQFCHHHNNSVLINPGSVGQSRQMGGRADWTLFDSSSKTFQLKSTSYNTQHLIQRIKMIDPELPYLQNILIRNTHEAEL